MALTPNGSTVPYATADDMAARYDVRTLGDWLSDTGVRLTPAQVASSAALSALLGEASGEFESRALRGRRYAVADLQALAAQAGNGQQYLAGLVCGWCMFLVWQRRPREYESQDVPPAAKLALEKLEALSGGEAVLPFLESEAAGLVAHYQETGYDVVRRGGAAVIAERFFGRRGNRECY